LLEKLKEKDVSIVILTKELAKTWPNLEDSEGLEYVEKEIIEIGKKQKINYGEIIEKVMIENLRLKYSIQTIGSEYNE
jgi:vacuolar-type H+-ATPase subunit F/Vma7